MTLTIINDRGRKEVFKHTSRIEEDVATYKIYSDKGVTVIGKNAIQFVSLEK